MVNYAVSDMLTRIRNGIRVKKTKVSVISTNLTRSIAEILKREGFIESFSLCTGHPSESTPEGSVDSQETIAEGTTPLRQRESAAAGSQSNDIDSKTSRIRGPGREGPEAPGALTSSRPRRGSAAATLDIYLKWGPLTAQTTREGTRGPKDGADGASAPRLLITAGNSRKNVLTNLKCVSRPGVRIYANVNNIPQVLGGLGITILSTSKGILTDYEARTKKVGGEVLCMLW